MPGPMRPWTVLVVAALLCGGASVVAAPQDGKLPVTFAGRTDRLKRLYQKMGYEEQVRKDVRARILKMVGNDAGKAAEAMARMKWNAVEDFLVGELDRRVDDRTLDEVLPFLDTPEGQRTLALVRLDRSLVAVNLTLAAGAGGEGFENVMRGYQEAVDKAIEDSSPEASSSKNELVAIATLRNLASCEAQIQTSGKIDCDADGIGEYGTFLEMTGSVGVRRHLIVGVPNASDFSVKGTPVTPAVLSPALQGVDADGIVTRKGYCFRIFLPDASPFESTRARGGFTHEKGPAAAVGLAGGTGTVGVDMSETTWCAYAWPVKRGVTGTRVFFVNQAGDVMQSSNEASQWSGVEKAPPWGSAFAGPGTNADVASGKKGNDGDLWTLTE